MGENSKQKAPKLENKLFALHVKCFGSVGFHPENFANSRRFYFGMFICTMLTAFSCLFSFLSFAFENRNNILDATEALCPTISVIILIAKILAFYSTQGKIFKLIDEMREMSARPERLDPVEFEWIKKVDRSGISIYMFSSITTGLFYCFEPMIRNLVKIAIASGEFDYELPYKASFPFDITFPPFYVIVYASQIWATYAEVIFSVKP